MKLWPIMTLLFLLSGCISPPPTQDPTPTPESPVMPLKDEPVPPPEVISPPLSTAEEGCVQDGGAWTLFSDGCGGKCAPLRGEQLWCTQALEWGCQCPSEQCWNGSGCEPL